MSMWNSAHVFTLVDKVSLDKAKAANDSDSKPTPEYGVQVTQEGDNSYLCNIRPSIINSENTLCLIRGRHDLHAKRYATLAEAKELISKWQLEGEALEP